MKENNPPVIGGETTIELIAGRHPNGELVVEKILVNPQPEENSFQLLKSPLFVRGVARTDVIQLKKGTQGQFNIVKHGGNLCVRVFSKQDFNSPQMEAIEQIISLISRAGTTEANNIEVWRDIARHANFITADLGELDD